jgi:hypothetical protein
MHIRENIMHYVSAFQFLSYFYEICCEHFAFIRYPKDQY